MEPETGPVDGTQGAPGGEAMQTTAPADAGESEAGATPDGVSAPPIEG